MTDWGVGWLGEAYLWVKALHVAFVVFWMAGLFMIPRFLVYWHSVEPAVPESALWDERCRRLRRIILSLRGVIALTLLNPLAIDLCPVGAAQVFECPRLHLGIPC